MIPARSSWLIAATLIVPMGPSAVAQEPRPGGFGERGGPPGGGGAPAPLVVALDADGDGELSPKEIDNAVAALRALDKNKDGKLTRDEYLPAGRGAAPGGPTAAELVERMMAFDKNGDGKLGRDELPERMQGLMDRADLNKDGTIDKDELSKLAQQQAARGGGPGDGRGGPGPDRGGDRPGRGPEGGREDRPRP